MEVPETAPLADEALERRRAQNRLAQRRFRQSKCFKSVTFYNEFHSPIHSIPERQETRKVADKDKNDQDGALPPMYPVAGSINSYFEEFLLTANDGSSTFSDGQDITHPQSSFYRSPSGATGFADNDSVFAQYVTTPLPSHAMPTLRSPSMDSNGILGSALAGKSAVSHHVQENNGRHVMAATYESTQWPVGSIGSSRQPPTGSERSTMGASLEGGKCSSSGWLNALHMAAREGHRGIVQVRK